MRGLLMHYLDPCVCGVFSLFFYLSIFLSPLFFFFFLVKFQVTSREKYCKINTFKLSSLLHSSFENLENQHIILFIGHWLYFSVCLLPRSRESYTKCTWGKRRRNFYRGQRSTHNATLIWSHLRKNTIYYINSCVLSYWKLAKTNKTKYKRRRYRYYILWNCSARTFHNYF